MSRHRMALCNLGTRWIFYPPQHTCKKHTLTARLAMGGDVAAVAAEAAMWSRARCDFIDSSGVKGVRAVVVGHTPFKKMTSLDNVIYIDTMGWKGRDFTILDAATLKPAEKPSTLVWEAA